MSYILIHNEYWDHRTGREIVFAAAESVKDMIVPESINVISKYALTMRGDEHGEMDIYWTVQLQDGWDGDDVFHGIRNGGIRVKELSDITEEEAKMDSDGFRAWFDRRYQESLAEYAAWEAEWNAADPDSDPI